MDNKVLITCDSTSDLNAELIERYNIKILPLGITLDEKTYIDGVNINPDFIYEYYKKTGRLPKTTATNLAECTEFFKKYVDEGYSIVHFSLSSEMSSTYNNARIAAMEFENVYVIDSRNLSSGIGLLIISAAEEANKGKCAKEIFDYSTSLLDKVDSSFIIDSLEFLVKGGRCSALAALGANLLKLKPCIQVKDGKMGLAKKYRGKFGDVLLMYVKDKLAEIDDIDTTRIFITHAGIDKDILNSLIDTVKNNYNFENIHLARAGCTISSHCGQNSFGILFIRKSPLKD